MTIYDYLNAYTGTDVDYDVVELENEYNLNLVAPGASKEDITLKTEGNKLLITSKPSYEIPIDNIRKDLGIVDLGFNITFKLPESVNTSKVKASVTNGILSIILPKDKNYTSTIKVD